MATSLGIFVASILGLSCAQAQNLVRLHGAITIVNVDKDLVMPVQLVTKPKPSDEVSKVVAAVKDRVK